MTFLLAILLVLIPFTVRAEYPGNLSANEFDSNSIAVALGGENPLDNEFELGPYSNLYSPSSATNFEAIHAPRLYAYRGNLSRNQYDLDSVRNPYGRYGNPYSSDSLNNPYGAGNPYSACSPTNPYGQGWRIEKR